MRTGPDEDPGGAGGEEIVPVIDRELGLVDERVVVEQLLARLPERDRAVVELRFFAGLTLEQAAECLDFSLSTADRAWRYARAWLYTAMSGGDSEKNVTES